MSESSESSESSDEGVLGATPFANSKASRPGRENGMVVDIDINQTAYANISRYFSPVIQSYRVRFLLQTLFCK